jgi:hypothetical protein
MKRFEHVTSIADTHCDYWQCPVAVAVIVLIVGAVPHGFVMVIDKL